MFSGALHKVPRDLDDGATVHVADPEGHVLGTGHYHRGSIAVRLFAFEEVVPDAAFWEQRIAQAIAYRRQAGILALPDTDGYRLVHGEGDGLSGLVVDRYADVVVMQCHSIGMHRQRHHLAEALRRQLGPEVRIYDKSKNALPPKYASEVSDGWLVGAGEAETVMREYGHRFIVDVAEGQKTGFFLDQRENRRYVASFCEGRT
ncbi:MAG: class I SAM-dependent rRNA methyltransferase, partial [Bacteroidetes bacterium]